MSLPERANQSNPVDTVTEGRQVADRLIRGSGSLTHSGKNTMKFYKQQREYYCGIDLHANSMHVCVVDQAGKKPLHKKFDTNPPEAFLLALAPFRESDLIIGCVDAAQSHCSNASARRPKPSPNASTRNTTRHAPTRCWPSNSNTTPTRSNLRSGSTNMGPRDDRNDTFSCTSLRADT